METSPSSPDLVSPKKPVLFLSKDKPLDVSCLTYVISGYNTLLQQQHSSDQTSISYAYHVVLDLLAVSFAIRCCLVLVGLGDRMIDIN